MPEFNYSYTLKGSFTVFDILNSSGTFYFRTIKSELLKGGIIFELKDTDFMFTYSVQNQSLVVQRNDTISILTLEEVPEDSRVGIFMMWSFSELTLLCQYGPRPEDQLKSMVHTTPCAPPVSLIKWARSQNLLPTKAYSNEEEFRGKVHSCLQSIQDKINESGGYSQFWNVTYAENSIKSRDPKKETEVHPIIHCLLSDQALLSSFEVIPEFKTGVGDLDFLVIAKLTNGDTSKVCIEFKHAHSDDLMHGILSQLPTYMRNSKAKYGVYGVLNFKGEWFEEPFKDPSIKLHADRFGSGDPIQQNIRSIYFDLGKPKSASKN